MALSKKEAGEELFFAGFTQKRIAQILEVSEQTVTRWAKDLGWDKKRADALATKESVHNRILKLVDYQLMAIEAAAEEKRQDGKTPPLDKGHIDSLSKLLSGIKAKEISFAQAVNLIARLTEFIHSQDAELAKQLIQYTDPFIHKLKEEYDN